MDKRTPRSRGPRASTAEEQPVGYKSPPRYGQFKPGQSGNPKGRPAVPKNMRSIIKKELSKPVKISEQGIEKKLTHNELIAKQLVRLAAKGNMGAIKYLDAHMDFSVEPPSEEARQKFLKTTREIAEKSKKRRAKMFEVASEKLRELGLSDEHTEDFLNTIRRDL